MSGPKSGPEPGHDPGSEPGPEPGQELDPELDPELEPELEPGAATLPLIALDWSPRTEAEAASNRAAFVEWLRATGRPAPAAEAELVALVFAFLNAARHPGWTRGWDDLPGFRRAVAWQLLVGEIRPDDVLTWEGGLDDPLLRAAVVLGAAIRFRR